MTLYDTPTQSDMELMPQRELRRSGLDIHDLEDALHIKTTLEKWRTAAEYKKELLRRVRARRNAVFQKLGMCLSYCNTDVSRIVTCFRRVLVDRRTLYEQEVVEVAVRAHMSEFKVGICNSKMILTDIDIKGLQRAQH